MLRFTFLSALLYLVGAAISLYSPASMFTALEGIGFLGLLVSLAYYGYRFLGWLKNRLLWKVRNKIIISYAFIGIIPLIILSFISWYSLKLIFGQLGALYLDNEIRSLGEELRHVNQDILLGYYPDRQSSAESAALLLRHARRILTDLPPALKNASLSVFRRDSGQANFRLIALVPDQQKSPAERKIPAWAESGFDGLVLAEGQLYFRSLVPVKDADLSYLLYLELPFDAELVAFIKRQTSIDVLPLTFSAASDLDTAFTTFLSQPPTAQGQGALSDFVSANRDFFSIRWAHPLLPIEWSTGQRLTRTVHGLVLAVPLQNLYDYYFNQSSGFGRWVSYMIAILTVVFVLAEGVAFLVAVTIARSITRSIHHIYTATRNIQQGNFQFRIPATNRDQLDSVALSFNNMAESIVRLMNQVSENERLEKEIEIAREVQAQLFPRHIPSTSRLQLAGACQPAQRVSGDSYDFILHDEHLLDIVISDISGKGISAALLMASLQACVRTQITYLFSDAPGEHRLAPAMTEINRYLYHHTSPEKFGTLVLSRFDLRAMTLSYCNAGHNPPLHISGDQITRLTVGGTVAGLFESYPFEEATIPLRADDLILFYTDGMVEAENARGEAFGEQRLWELLKENAFLTSDDLQILLFNELSQWVAGAPQLDDMTVVVAKVGR